jgi:NADP-reducing hydrogenase subunit HndA
MSNQFVETTEQRQQLKKVLASLSDVKGSLMMAMQKAQEIYGYLPIEIQTRIADACGVPLEEVYGIATFYSQFNINPLGKYKVGVCLGTACYVRGSGAILDKLIEKMGIEPGQTSADGKFTLEATRCIGCCGLAPVLTVNEHVYGNLTADDVEKILYKYND